MILNYENTKSKPGPHPVKPNTKKLSPVLLVEDEDDYVALIRESFQKVEIPNPLFAVRTPEDAIAYLAGEGKFARRAAFPFPCLMLLDLRLPPKSGFDVLRWLSTRPNLKQKLNVVVLSAVNTPDEIQMAYDLGAQYFMKKPDFQGLEEKARYLKGSWLRVDS
jgi:CheY-like chemotaxis protein